MPGPLLTDLECPDKLQNLIGQTLPCPLRGARAEAGPAVKMGNALCSTHRFYQNKTAVQTLQEGYLAPGRAGGTVEKS